MALLPLSSFFFSTSSFSLSLISSPKKKQKQPRLRKFLVFPSISERTAVDMAPSTATDMVIRRLEGVDPEELVKNDDYGGHRQIQAASRLTAKELLAGTAKSRFSAKDYSDHMALVRAYEGWKDADREGSSYEYCWRRDHCCITVV